MKIVICLLMGYLVGMVNPSYIVGRLKGFDIRKSGSGNAGGSNALITMGTLIGIFCILFDIAKAFIIVKAVEAMFPDLPLAFSCAMIGVVLGHIFPVYMRFRGGKGLACLAGSIIAFDPIVFLIMLAAEMVIALVTNYICFVPLSASVAFPIIYGIMTRNLTGALLMLIVTAAIYYRHRENIVRIKNGTEMRVSYLWNKQGERDRVVSNAEGISED